MSKILKAKDAAKDQSYFLWQIKKKQLDKILLPIGEFENKGKVREFAELNGLITATKKDSQGLCFVGQTSLAQMLLQTIGSKTGLIINQIEKPSLIKNPNIQNFLKNKNNKKSENQSKNQSKTEVNQIINPENLEKLHIILEKFETEKKENSKKVLIIDFEILNKIWENNFKNTGNLRKLTELNSKKSFKESNENDADLWEKLDQFKKQILLKKTTEKVEFYQILGLHSGAFLYTIGQRQNLNLSGGPWFVAQINIPQNLVLVVNQTQINSQKLENENQEKIQNLKKLGENSPNSSDFSKIYCTKILVKSLNWQNLPKIQNSDLNSDLISN